MSLILEPTFFRQPFKPEPEYDKVVEHSSRTFDAKIVITKIVITTVTTRSLT